MEGGSKRISLGFTPFPPLSIRNIVGAFLHVRQEEGEGGIFIKIIKWLANQEQSCVKKLLFD